MFFFLTVLEKLDIVQLILYLRDEGHLLKMAADSVTFFPILCVCYCLCVQYISGTKSCLRAVNNHPTCSSLHKPFGLISRFCLLFCEQQLPFVSTRDRIM